MFHRIWNVQWQIVSSELCPFSELTDIGELVVVVEVVKRKFSARRSAYAILPHR